MELKLLTVSTVAAAIAAIASCGSILLTSKEMKAAVKPVFVVTRSTTNSDENPESYKEPEKEIKTCITLLIENFGYAVVKNMKAKWKDESNVKEIRIEPYSNNKKGDYLISMDTTFIKGKVEGEIIIEYKNIHNKIYEESINLVLEKHNKNIITINNLDVITTLKFE
jgi:hypothetical protein